MKSEHSDNLLGSLGSSIFLFDELDITSIESYTLPSGGPCPPAIITEDCVTEIENKCSYESIRNQEYLLKFFNDKSSNPSMTFLQLVHVSRDIAKLLQSIFLRILTKISLGRISWMATNLVSFAILKCFRWEMLILQNKV